MSPAWLVPGGAGESAIVAHLASGLQLRQAVILAKAYVTKAIEKSYAIGKGAGDTVTVRLTERLAD